MREPNLLVYWPKKTRVKGQEGAVGASHCAFLDNARNTAESHTHHRSLLNIAIVDTHQRLVEVVQGCIGPEMKKAFDTKHRGWAQVDSIPPTACGTRVYNG